MEHSASMAGALMMDLEGLSVSAGECELISRPQVGGLILFSRNFASKNQIRDLVSSIRECSPEIIVAVDQEGGRVQRFKDGFLELPALYQVGKLYSQNKDAGLSAARECGWAMSSELTDLGIDISFAPVLDLYSESSKVIAERAFSSNPDEVITLGLEYIEGMHEGGMAACGKHFPGHGTVIADSHVDLPQDNRSAEEIMGSDCRVFEACAQLLDGVMPAHVIYPAVDDACAGFSKIWIEGILRQKFAFEGVVFSDDLLMKAAHSVGSIENRAQQALAAGCDMLLVCNEPQSAQRVLDWLAQQEHPGSRRIAAMRSKTVPGTLDFDSERWSQAKQLMTQLHAIA